MSDRFAEFDRMADAFEQEWLEGNRPRLQEWLLQVSGSDQVHLARMLFPVEFEQRIKLGEYPHLDEYEFLSDQLIPIAQECLHEVFGGTVPDPPAGSRLNPALAPLELAPGIKIGPYSLLRPLGRGGMGEVWLAQQNRPVQRQVALKLIKKGFNSQEILARFEAERQALALMSHPNIATILDAGVTPEGQPYFAMEYVEGSSITKYCNQNSLGIDERLRLFLDVCRGVQHAHQKGIIHRDLKPSNIIIGERDGRPITKIIDFGLAKAMDNAQQLTDLSLITGIGQILGTLKYMSPEQAGLNNLDIDTRTDIFSMGVILYELLTGETPLEDSSIKDRAILKVLEIIRDLDSPKPSSRVLHVAQSETIRTLTFRSDIKALKTALLGDLDWITIKALENNRNRRYDSAAGLAEDVQRFLDKQPVLARPPSLFYSFQKTIQRHRLLSFAAILVVAAGLIALGGIVYGWRADRHYRLVSEAELAFEKLFLPLQSQPGLFGKKQVDQLLPLVDSIARLDRDNANSKLQRLLHSYGLEIRLKLESSELTMDGIAECQRDLSELKLLASRINDAVLNTRIGSLDQLWLRRNTDWILAYAGKTAISIPKEAAPPAVEKENQLNAQPLPSAASREGELLLLTASEQWRLGPELKDVSSIRVAFEMKPKAILEFRTSVITLLTATGSSYEFCITTEGELASLNNQTEISPRCLLQIKRAGSILASQSFVVSSADRWSLQLEVDRGQVRFSIDDASLDARDIFAFDGSQLSCMVQSNASILLNDFRVHIRPRPELPTTIEKGDYSFSNQDFLAALKHYEKSTIDEAVYKKARCEIQLGRYDDALQSLELVFRKQVVLGNDQPWHLLAGLQLFGLLAERNYLQRSTEVLTAVIANYQGRFSQYTAYISPALQSQILNLARRDGHRFKLTIQSQGDTSLLRFARQFEAAIPNVTAERRRGTLWKLADALRVEGDLVEAETILLELHRELSDDPGASDLERVTLIQDLCWLYINMDRLAAASQLIEDSWSELEPADSPRLWGLLMLEKARLLAIQQNLDEASTVLDQFFARVDPDLQSLTHGQYADACALAGYLAKSANDEAKAKKYWLKGHRKNWPFWNRDKQEVQGFGQHEINLSFSMSYELILHSLTGASRSVDIEESTLADMGSRSATGDLSGFARLFPVPSLLLTGILKGVFNLPQVGEQWRSEMILHTCSLKDFYYRPLKLILHQGVRVFFLAGVNMDADLERDSFGSTSQLVDMFDRDEVQIERDFPLITTFLLTEFSELRWSEIKKKYTGPVASGMAVIKAVALDRQPNRRQDIKILSSDVSSMSEAPESFRILLNRLAQKTD
jgi:serine/threonine protein kinase